MRLPSISYRDIELLTRKAEAYFKAQNFLKDRSFFGDAPAPFIGRFGYPCVNVGILSPPDKPADVWLYDAPKYWAASGYGIPKIVELRSSLINSRFKTNVKQLQAGRLLDISREVGMAEKPVEVEIALKSRPSFKLNADAYAPPMGPNAEIAYAKVTSNPAIHQKVQRAVDDSSLKATQAITELYKAGFDENFLSKLLSVGAVGIKESRKLVPTRWSITATDDILGKKLISEIKDYPVSNCSAFFGGYLGNYYLILFFSEMWSYELFETYLPQKFKEAIESKKAPFSTDYESFFGRKNYAKTTAGGYYSARLAIAEKLRAMKRQASVLALRFITDEYLLPLGVWVTREAARKALASKPIGFDCKDSALNYTRIFVKQKFGYDLDGLLRHSIMLKCLGRQRSLMGYL